MTFSLWNLLFLASEEVSGRLGCELAAWMKTESQNISLARIMWRGKNNKEALTHFLKFYSTATFLSIVNSVTDKSRRHWVEDMLWRVGFHCSINRCCYIIRRMTRVGYNGKFCYTTGKVVDKTQGDLLFLFCGELWRWCPLCLPA